MNIFLDNFFQGGKYSAQIASHQAQLKIQGNFTEQKYLSISSLHTDYLNIDISSGSGKNSQEANIVQTKFNFCGGANHSAEKYSKRIRKDEGKYRAASDSDKQQTERTPCKCLRW